MKMKRKNIIVSLFLVYCSTLFAQNTSFMGIPLDYSYLAFNRELSSKYQFEYEDEKSAHYKGTFAGLKDCTIYVERNKKTNGVYQVCVILGALESNLVDRFLISLSQKYGSVYEHKYNEGYLTGFCYKSGYTKILFDDFHRRFRDDKNRRTVCWIRYYPNGYINAESNVRINTCDL